MSVSVHAWAVAFLVTLAVEVPLWWLLLRACVPDRRAVGTGLAVNALTHPTLWLIWGAVHPGPADYWTVFAVAETAVTLGEAALARAFCRQRVPWRDALLASVVANGASMAAGLLFSLL